MGYAGQSLWEPMGWSPHASVLPAATAARMDLRIHPVANPTNPGYAYGTMIPNKLPYTTPVAKTFLLQIPMKPQLQGVTPNTARGIAITGAIDYLPVSDTMDDNAMQASIAAMRR